MLFAGETRYRVPWDFLIALSATVAAIELVRRLTVRRDRLTSRRALHEPRRASR
jgi:hypothetical protein